MEVNSIRLLGERRVKIISLLMLILIPCVLFFITLAIRLETPNNFTLMVLMYVVFGLLFVFGVYLLFNTNTKLLTANIFVGLCFGTLSIVVYGGFLYVITKGNLVLITKAFGLYLLACIITEVILFKIRYFDFKKTEKMSNSFWFALLGIGIGKAGYHFVKSVYGVFCKNFLQKVASNFSIVLHHHFP